MTIRKKSREELQHQAEGFLDYAQKNGKISVETGKEIGKILGLNEDEKKGLIERLGQKFGKKIDVSEKGDIEKVLKKKDIDFEELWDEYLKYLHGKSVDKHKIERDIEIRKKVEMFFEPYKTPDDNVNGEIINIIAENYSKDVIEKFKIFITSSIYKEAYFSGKIKSGQFLWYFLKKTEDAGDLTYLLKNLSLGEFEEIWHSRWISISRKKVELIKLLKYEFYQNCLSDIINTRGIVDSPFMYKYEKRLDSIKNNISILKVHGYDIKKIKNVKNFLLIEDVSLYVELLCSLNDFIFNHKDYEKELCQEFEDKSKEELFCKCINFSKTQISELLQITPDIHYENNGGYSSYSVNMFGGDWDNQELTEKLVKNIVGLYIKDEDVKLLSIIWKSKWTQNRKKNIDCAFDHGLISQKTIVSCDEYRTQRERTNMYIASLKLLDYDVFKFLIRNGVTRESFQEFCTWIEKDYIGNLQQIIGKYPDITLEGVNVLKDVISSANPKNLKIIFERYPEILIEDLSSLSNILESANPENLNIIFTHFRPINLDEIEECGGLLSLSCLPGDLDFKEENHKGYLKYLIEIVNMGYSSSKKLGMMKKICSLTFSQAKSYLEIFQMLDESISMDIQRVKNELIDEVLESDNPGKIADAIIDIFERNNLPLTGKIFKVFELLYPKEKFKSTLQSHGSPVLHKFLDEGKNVYSLIYVDLMNIAINSGDRSLRNYISTFVGSEKVLKKFESIINEPGFDSNDKFCLEGKLEESGQEQLLYLFRKCSVLYSRYYGKDIEEGDAIEDKTLGISNISDDQLVKFYSDLKKGFHLKKGESIYDRLQRFLLGLGYHSFEEVLDKMNESKKQAHERGLNLYNESSGGRIKFPQQAFLKGVDENAFSQIINRGITCREYLGGGENGNAAGSDGTPFDIDGWYSDLFVEGGYGNVKLVINTKKGNIYDSREEGVEGYTKDKYELFKTGVCGEKHYGIRTGVPTTEVDYVIYTGNFESKDFEAICYEIARNGYYIPITDIDGNIKFTPEMYHRIRAGFNYMEYYDGFDVQENDGKYKLKESDNKVYRIDSDDELVGLITENSPQNEKYRNFAKENRELAESTIEWIKKILEEKCGIRFNSKYDTSITGAELHDSGSTGRGTDIPTKDVDLDFTLLLDAKDYERVDEIKKIIHEEIGTLKNDDHDVQEGGNQIKSKINNIGKSKERPDGVPLDLLILKKSQVIDYSSSDAMKEKLEYIANNSISGVEDLERVRTNVIIMKKLLKAKGCYKKPEGGIAGIGVENWIIQNHGNFIEALESFEQVAYGGIYEQGKYPLSLSEFRKLYPIYDAGENYKDGCNDNFVYKLQESGYQGTLEIIKTYRLEGIAGIRRLIEEYEQKKAEFI